MKRNIWIWYASPYPIVQVRCGGGSRGRQSGGRVGDVGPKARWQDEHRCMVKSGRWNWRDEKDRRLLFRGHLLIIWFFVLCMLLRCGLDIQWIPMTSSEWFLLWKSALSRTCTFNLIVVRNPPLIHCEGFSSQGENWHSQWLLDSLVHYVACFCTAWFTLHNFQDVPFDLTCSYLKICLILLSNYHVVSRHHPNRHGQSLCIHSSHNFFMLLKQRKR